eukprot:gnl/Hemi2/3086_TR1091_c0_g1_i1.p1 gnl/Hemi2/3086_TR1091_c0_g1~~gnl/Hemi2/3086_TR1091_c0_g1_i1.p1  ORF type:complete len:483 (+),score=162.10 gnl/Hemi2/3086_TR1091_c0_g1_i1:78-1526(+)
MLCALTGQVPVAPVVSTKSGHLFERSVIEKHLKETGTCPVTNQPLTIDQLMPIQTNPVVKPRNLVGASVPDMLSSFQNEWDTLMLETYRLKEQLDQARQELSQALYQHDAACRVIARLIKERDEARNAVQNTHLQGGTAATTASGIPAEIIKKMQQKSSLLSQARKRRLVSPGLATPEQLEQYRNVKSNMPHSATAPGVLCLDVHPEQKLVLTGGADSNAVLFNRETGKVVCTLQGHTSRLSEVLFHTNENSMFSSSHDGTVRIWRPEGESYASACTFRSQSGGGQVVGLSLHPTGEYLVSASTDMTWSVLDIHVGETITQIAHPQILKAYTCVSCHPDGLILGTGTADSLVRIWDMKTQSFVAKFEGHSGNITSICFSENGYNMATAGADSTVKIWDLRKLLNTRTITIEGDTSINAVSFDHSGVYLGIAGSALSIYSMKSPNVVKVFGDHTNIVTDVKFGSDCRWLASTSNDRSLRFYSE